ncbi:hypothetical protein L202_05869 [Cryptococcus amylolentus CBS 6039]|uniref:Uncharacterized protein n=1 Tax=Cryptococcus amylolentus CBS 6039 TaxID=1295533 RepID=A0A1E3HK99_9TREE|nr:hypothetical protein L202_05869 [Cryptococcus amylolentus CBS 6039]ODN75881.1 hypothetical protein L202_05869 [Cryptococcus amylolentus CBS 6039]
MPIYQSPQDHALLTPYTDKLVLSGFTSSPTITFSRRTLPQALLGHLAPSNITMPSQCIHRLPVVSMQTQGNAVQRSRSASRNRVELLSRQLSSSQSASVRIKGPHG